MSAYLGFEPTKNPIYYFVSYNNEDVERVGSIAKTMSYSGIHLWYDHGIEYGDNWETIIAERIQNAQAIVLFFTKGILQKSHSYVQKEYKMATQFYNKKIYIVMLDRIANEDVPVDKVSWWIDINEKQCIDGFKHTSVPSLVEDFARALGIQTHEDKMNKAIEQYNELYHGGRIAEAERCLSEYLHGVSLWGKVRLLSNIVRQKMPGTTIISPARKVEEKLQKPLYTHMKEPKYQFFDCKQITIENDVYTVANEYLFHRGDRGDAHIIWIWKNDELIHTVGGLVEATDLGVYWDSQDRILYVSYTSERERVTDTYQYIGSDILPGITTVELSGEEIVCTNFDFSENKSYQSIKKG
ncbi:MAG: toll/interleukin-1 receptor domain-containing protein [Clostridia bacterium]|nr:toll/interleukin-1 receptor domain-containing protein [Clostridia bacterium]